MGRELLSLFTYRTNKDFTKYGSDYKLTFDTVVTNTHTNAYNEMDWRWGETSVRC